jgi:hypothetical protein
MGPAAGRLRESTEKKGVEKHRGVGPGKPRPPAAPLSCRLRNDHDAGVSNFLERHLDDLVDGAGETSGVPISINQIELGQSAGAC